MRRSIEPTPPFSLHSTCGPVAWGRGRWPNHDWIGGSLVWVGWDADRVVYRRILPSPGDGSLEVIGTAAAELDQAWGEATLGTNRQMPPLSDPVLRRIAETYPGLRPYASGSIFDGLVDSIVGQSITVVAAAVVSARISSLFHPGIELEGRIFWPSPRPQDLADADVSRLRRTGLTWRRAEALIAAGRAALDGTMPDPEIDSPVNLAAGLRTLPLVGEWTSQSTLIWGIGADDAFPRGDVALLRAARRAYEVPDMTMAELETISADWAGHRGWASRLLWTDLLGPAPAFERQLE